MTADRGNAVPETALTVSFTLLVLYGIVQLATTAFYQVSADGASFVASHDTVATLGNPTSANKSSAALAASGAFSKIVAASISVANPSNSTFETDVNQQIPGISALGNPQALTITSRQIEASSGTAGPASPLMNCTQSTLDIVNKANGTVVSKADVGLLQASSLLAKGPVISGGSSVLSLDTGALVTRSSLLNSVSTNFANAVSQLKTITAPIQLIPIVGPSIVSTLSTALSAVVQDAFNGTFNAASELSGVDSKLNVLPGVTSFVVNTVVNPILTANGTGILGTSGPLAALTNDIKSLQVIDAAATKCP